MKLAIFVSFFILFAYTVPANSKICLWVRGTVKCADSTGIHDRRVVVVRLVDARRGTLDHGVAAKSGRFALYGCHMSASSHSFQPELHVLHDCKASQQRRIIVPVRHANRHEYNISSVIDLSAYNELEAPAPVNLSPPCTRE